MYILPGALAPLASYRQFLLVELSPAVDKLGAPIPGKTVKHPVHPVTRYRHDAHDPTIWRDVSTIAALAASLGPQYIVGFVITANDPIVCLDMDECTGVLGGWIPEVQTMLAALPGAVELSNSGRGLHVWSFYNGVAPQHGKKSEAGRGKKWLELYTELRFIALGSSCTGAMQDVTAILPGFIAQYFPPGAIGEASGDDWRDGPIEGYTPLTDDELIAKAMSRGRPQSAAVAFGAAKPLPCFADLWTRDLSVLSLAFPPQMANKDIDGSDADFALAKELAYWTGKDHTRIARLMWQSGLARDKWKPEVHRSYFRETVQNGVFACQAVYHVKPIVPTFTATAGVKLAPKVIDHNTFIGRETMAQLFAGCVYVQDNNAILLPNGDIVDQARFKAKYAGYTFSMDNDNVKVSKDAWEAFLHNQVIQFPRVEGTVFQPGMGFQDVVERAGRHWVNVYKAPIVDRKPGDVKPFMDLLHKILPNGDDAIILLSYMAAVVQYPGVKFRWAPFVQGTQGNGKSTLIECLKYALGYKYIFSVKAEMITNGFNSWLEHNMLYVADDIYSTADRSNIMEALKSLITDRDQPVTLKGIDSIQKVICGNFVFTDNHKDAMKKQDDSRRICTLYSAQQSPYDRRRDGLTKAFFVGPGGFVPWLESGGYAHVAELLYTMPIDPRYNPAGECQEAPETSVTKEAIVDGRTGVEHEVVEWIELDEPGFCGDFVSFDLLRKKLLNIQQFARSATHLKIKEMLGRLGYEIHRGLPEGRTEIEVQPDDKRSILYIKRDSWLADLTDPALIAELYTQAQQAAITAAVNRRFNQQQMGVS